MPTKVKLRGCNDQICEFHRDKPVTAEMSFTARRPSKMVYASVDVNLSGFWVSLASNEKVCSKLIVGECPLKSGGKYTYRGTNTVPKKVPTGMTTTVRLRATDDLQGTIACVIIRVKIVD